MAAVSCVLREHGTAHPHAITEFHLDDRARREGKEDVGARAEADQPQPRALRDMVTGTRIRHDAPGDETGNLTHQHRSVRSTDADRSLLVVETRLFYARVLKLALVVVHQLHGALYRIAIQIGRAHV